MYKTSPSSVLLRESGLNPAETLLDKIVRKAAIRTRRLDPRHSLHSRALQIRRSPNKTSLSRHINSIPLSDLANPIIFPPWENKNNCSKQSISSIPANDVIVFSDRSKLSDGRCGGGFVIFQHGHKICSKSFPLKNFFGSL